MNVAQKKHVQAVNLVQELPWGFDHPYITISKADFHGVKPHKDDPIVAQLRVNSFNIRRVFWIKVAPQISFMATRLTCSG